MRYTKERNIYEHKRNIKRAYEEEESPVAKKVIEQLLENAQIALKSAIQLDSNYAKAYGALGTVEQELGESPETMLHISKLAKHRVKNVNDVLDEGQKIAVTVLKATKDRIELVATDVLED